MRKVLNFLREVDWLAVAGLLLFVAAALVAVFIASAGIGLAWGILALVLAVAGLAFYVRR